MMDDEADVEARHLRERGYAVLERTHTAEQVARFRRGLEAVHQRHGSPVPYAPRVVDIASGVQLAPTGFVVSRLVATFPELADDLLSPRVVATARRLLGDDVHLELTGGVICDDRRPFFTWHNHIGGIDVEDYRAREDFPRFTESQRVIVVVYLDDIDELGGELRALPRAITDRTEPPFDQSVPDWPAQVPIHCPAGSTVVFEQCTWHAAMPKRRPGLRMFVGAYLTSSRAPKTQAIDDSLRGFRGGGPAFRSLLPT